MKMVKQHNSHPRADATCVTYSAGPGNSVGRRVGLLQSILQSGDAFSSLSHFVSHLYSQGGT